MAESEADGKVVFLRQIIPGGADRSYGIHVAQLAGIPLPVIQWANEILHQLEMSSGKAAKINPAAPTQMALFPETNPLVDELKELDVNSLSPIEALKKIYEWQRNSSLRIRRDNPYNGRFDYEKTDYFYRLLYQELKCV